ncbi:MULTISPECIES: DUF4365 domain-containing protein [unclassified Okeania]|uniref:DUF4365 domain-containing protein n=1 Tax=unclassified Okeania TaxID=2634635 RepID=UPI0013BC8750|nr:MULTISPECIES: DUF4365 domain-containing protein [unclassified Okeania]NES74382.1 DUF4365 domain-containing protein [Okeania sp. SIO1H4]NET16459.1 DUF4365 domain-containing protein [Okeania sp. SIO1H6]NET23641.1 DUF4365 domain-containing protein [Okeania sp. SIO1H5]NET92263.1 DUF4365 domain-containing protein [Okeania sp. SIO1H2]
MHITQQQEQFSNAYLRAVATVAGYSLSKPDVDDDSIDWSIHKRGGNGTIRSPRIELQLKCLLRDNPINSEGIKYDLKVKNYNELIPENVLVPRILVVVVVPRLPESLLTQSDEQTILKYCAYWISLRGKPPTDNNTTVRVNIPQKNRLTVNKLSQLMEIVASGDAP